MSTQSHAPITTTAMVRNLRGVARRLDEARGIDHLLLALRLNQRTWERMQDRANRVAPGISSTLIGLGLTMATSANQDHAMDDQGIQAMINLNRRMAEALTTSPRNQ
jgi:hypothetical protein